MAEIKAIETLYNGYRFRSRLEARWAVFFDALDIKYEYEPEGLWLYDGTQYLPDFYLCDFQCYFEVKRKGLEKTEEGRMAIDKISSGAWSDSFAGIICFGDPVDDCLTIYCQESDDGGGGSYEDSVTIGIHPKTGRPHIYAFQDRRDRAFFTSWGNPAPIPMTTSEYGTYRYTDFVTPEVMMARQKARQARFEFGETPAASNEILTTDQANKLRDKITGEFIEYIKPYDRHYGGPLNLCNWLTIREEFSKWATGKYPLHIKVQTKAGTTYIRETVKLSDVHMAFSPKQKLHYESLKRR